MGVIFMLKYAKIRDRDIANGPGVRVSIFFQGCLHQCQGCFNPETWNPKMGFELTKEKIDKIFSVRTSAWRSVRKQKRKRAEVTVLHGIVEKYVKNLCIW